MKLQTELETQIMQILNRYLWARWEGKKKCEERSRYKIPSPGRYGYAFRYFCEKCKKRDLIRKEVEIHHIVPRLDPELGWQGLQDWVDKTFCDAKGLVCLCLPCHDEIHAGDAKKRVNRIKKTKTRTKKKKPKVRRKK
jgi:hypothetical protein